MRFLIVDDDRGVQNVAKAFLEEYAQCETASDGREAISKVQTAWEHGDKFECIFMDIMMPGMDGIAALKEIRRLENESEEKAFEPAKIIMLTASNDPKDVIGAFKEDSDGYIVKPFDMEKLLDKLKRCDVIH